MTPEELRFLREWRQERTVPVRVRPTVHLYPRSVRVAVMAEWLVGRKTIAQICREWDVPPSTLHKWAREMHDHFVSRHRKELLP